MNRALLAIAALLTPPLVAGCLIDRGPLPPATTERDSSVADASGDVGELPDAWTEPDEDASTDAFTPIDAWDPTDAWSEPDTGPDAPRCTPRCTSATSVILCDGDTERADDCKLGCNAATARCFAVNPSNVPTSLFDEASTELSISSPTTIDTAVMGRTITQRDGSQVSVLVHTSVTISSTVTVVGPRPLVIIARDGVDISGTLDASAMGATPGPRGMAGASSVGGSAAGPGAGQGGGHAGDWADGGGGGGGLCGTGGTGGDGNGGRGGRGGGPTDIAADPETLRGGGGGGAGNGDGSLFGVGGAGGGAIQISTRGTLTVSGRIVSRGSSGAPGRGGSGNDAAGGGGGSGGFILLEGSLVDVSGGVDATGAPGGSGDGGGGGGAAGGGAAGSNGGDGGDHSAAFDAGNGGGGGGGAGCVVVRSFDPPVLRNVAPSDAIGLHSLPLMLE